MDWRHGRPCWHRRPMSAVIEGYYTPSSVPAYNKPRPHRGPRAPPCHRTRRPGPRNPRPTPLVTRFPRSSRIWSYIIEPVSSRRCRRPPGRNGDARSADRASRQALPPGVNVAPMRAWHPPSFHQASTVFQSKIGLLRSGARRAQRSGRNTDAGAVLGLAVRDAVCLVCVVAVNRADDFQLMR